MIQNENVVVNQVPRQTSDHAIISLDNNPERARTKEIIWESKWRTEPKNKELVNEVWGRSVEGSRIFKIKQKLKWSKHEFIKRRKRQESNTKKEIELIQNEMEQM